MAAHILDTLEKAEEDWRAQSPQWKAKVGKWKAWQARQKNKERVTQKAAAQRRDRDDDGAGSIPQQSEGHSWESYFDPKDPSPQFSFAGASSYSKEELLADIASLSWTSTPDFLFRALWRGIAVHHSGMNKSYRVLVERCAPIILSDYQRLSTGFVPLSQTFSPWLPSNRHRNR